MSYILTRIANGMIGMVEVDVFAYVVRYQTGKVVAIVFDEPAVAKVRKHYGKLSNTTVEKVSIA